MIKLKNLTLKSRVVQSPMAGCTNLAFRMIARQHGMEYAFPEMVSCEALVRHNANTKKLLKTHESDRPLGIQLVGCNPENMAESAAMVEDLGFDSVDINMGCPVPKIVSPGGGSALLTEPEKARKIFESMMKRLKRVALTVKMRIGFKDASGAEAIRIAQIAEECGLSAIAVHGRTRAQSYTGKADWGVIGKIKRAVNIPVFGNGDVNSGRDAIEMLKTSGCDGVMIGRGALGNPWIYQEIEAALQGDAPPASPSVDEKRATLLKHMELELETEGEPHGILHMRRIACWYFKNLPGASEFRGKINQMKTRSEMRALIEDFKPRSAPTPG